MKPQPLSIVLRCEANLVRRVKYVLDTLLMAAGVEARYAGEPPAHGPWLLYAGRAAENGHARDRCVSMLHAPEAWALFETRTDDIEAAAMVDGVPTVLSNGTSSLEHTHDIRFDLVANAFYFLSSWSERYGTARAELRQLQSTSVFSRLGIPQDIVDRYLARLVQALSTRGLTTDNTAAWPQGAGYALVLSHDIDFLPQGAWDIARQGAKTLARHLWRQRAPGDALRAMTALARAFAQRRDPYGCIPYIIERERAMGVRSSFQVAVGHRHPADVEYRIEDDRVCDYLRAITDADFDLCLHGSVRSTENPHWYLEEAQLLASRLAVPRGSRQHFLSFDYDALFAAQERAGIRYDMSVGYPDKHGPRAGFSHPYFPYCIEADRPYDVLQIGLVLMDVTLRGYMDLQPRDAWSVIEQTLAALKATKGCMSAVWHPIVFGGARDPGYDDLYWRMVSHVGQSGGVATDGRTIDAHFRCRAQGYVSFQRLSPAPVNNATHVRRASPARHGDATASASEVAWPTS